MDSIQLREWLISLAGIYEEELDYLSELDSAIADGDHGISMVRGFRAVKEALSKMENASITELFNTTARVMMKDIGGTCGPLFAMFFMKGAAAMGGAEKFETKQYAAFLKGGTDGVMALGKGKPGGKTMIDAIYPAAEALAAAGDIPFEQAVTAAADAAEKGRDSTADMPASFGRARYQTDKGVGHIDAGAASMAIMLRSLEAFVK